MIGPQQVAASCSMGAAGWPAFFGFMFGTVLAFARVWVFLHHVDALLAPRAKLEEEEGQ